MKTGIWLIRLFGPDEEVPLQTMFSIQNTELQVCVYIARPSHPFSCAEVLSFINIPNKVRESEALLPLVPDSILEFK